MDIAPSTRAIWVRIKVKHTNTPRSIMIGSTGRATSRAWVPYRTTRTSTYAFIDGAYGMMNNQDLAIGESTCGARITALPVSEGGQALMDARELSLIALERCATARCAVELMGGLAEAHGKRRPYGVARRRGG